MNTYRVTWGIDIAASSPLEAAQIAREMHLDAKASIGSFKVHSPDKHGWCIVDLTPDLEVT